MSIRRTKTRLAITALHQTRWRRRCAGNVVQVIVAIAIWLIKKQRIMTKNTLKKQEREEKMEKTNEAIIKSNWVRGFFYTFTRFVIIVVFRFECRYRAVVSFYGLRYFTTKLNLKKNRSFFSSSLSLFTRFLSTFEFVSFACSMHRVNCWLFNVARILFVYFVFVSVLMCFFKNIFFITLLFKLLFICCVSISIWTPIPFQFLYNFFPFRLFVYS